MLVYRKIKNDSKRIKVYEYKWINKNDNKNKEYNQRKKENKENRNSSSRLWWKSKWNETVT